MADKAPSLAANAFAMQRERPESLELVEAPAADRKAATREPHGVARASAAGDRVFNAATTLLAACVLVTLAATFVVLVVGSWPSITRFGLSFLTSSTWDSVRNVYGAGPAILGTVYISLLALLLAGPVGVLVAVFLVEMALRPVRSSLGFLVELLGAVPSIVFGLWALFVLVPLVRTYVDPTLSQHFGNTPLFSGFPLGLGMLPAALILAIMILPTIASISRDVIAAVPNSQREAMLALGATRWEMTWRVVFPVARSGVVGAIILGLGRAVGETMAVQMVIGNTFGFSISLLSTGTTMPATIVNQFSEATGQLYRSSLIELALILMFVTVLLNVMARLLVFSVSRVG